MAEDAQPQAELVLPGGTGVTPLVITDFSPTVIEEAQPPTEEEVKDKVRTIGGFYMEGKVGDPDLDAFDMRPLIFPSDAVVDEVPKDSSVITPVDSSS